MSDIWRVRVNQNHTVGAGRSNAHSYFSNIAISEVSKPVDPSYSALSPPSAIFELYNQLIYSSAINLAI
jgi:hypothetical protein